MNEPSRVWPWISTTGRSSIVTIVIIIVIIVTSIVSEDNIWWKYFESSLKATLIPWTWIITWVEAATATTSSPSRRSRRIWTSIVGVVVRSNHVGCEEWRRIHVLRCWNPLTCFRMIHPTGIHSVRRCCRLLLAVSIGRAGAWRAAAGGRWRWVALFLRLLFAAFVA